MIDIKLFIFNKKYLQKYAWIIPILEHKLLFLTEPEPKPWKSLKL